MRVAGTGSIARHLAVGALLVLAGCLHHEDTRRAAPAPPRPPKEQVARVIGRVCMTSTEPGETHRCYFEPEVTRSGDYSTIAARAVAAQQAFAGLCREVVVVSDDIFDSADVPPRTLRRVGVQCRR